MSNVRETFEEKRLRLLEESKTIISVEQPNFRQFDREFDELVELVLFSLLSDQNNGGCYFGNVILQLNRTVTYVRPVAVSHQFMGTHFNFILNPFILLKYNLEEMKQYFIHECYHIMLQHIKRTQDYWNTTPMPIINLACDLVVNQYSCVKPLSHWWTLGRMDRDFEIRLPKNLSVEEYIALLEEHYKTNETFAEFINAQSVSLSEVRRILETLDDELDEELVTVLEELLQELNLSMSDVSCEESLFDMVKNITVTASSNSRGELPDGVQGIIEKLIAKPEIPWQRVLKGYVGRVPVPYKKSIMRRDRRQPNRMDLRGRLSDRMVNIVVAIDTSGSMSDREIAYCMNEVFSIVKHSKHHVTVIECDSKVQRVYEAKSPSDIKPDVQGRGGTMFSPVFEEIKERGIKDAICIFFTDGGGERKLTTRPTTFKNLWVVTDPNYGLSLEEPYGTVKYLDHARIK